MDARWKIGVETDRRCEQGGDASEKFFYQLYSARIIWRLSAVIKGPGIRLSRNYLAFGSRNERTRPALISGLTNFLTRKRLAPRMSSYTVNSTNETYSIHNNNYLITYLTIIMIITKASTMLIFIHLIYLCLLYYRLSLYVSAFIWANFSMQKMSVQIICLKFNVQVFAHKLMYFGKLNS